MVSTDPAHNSFVADAYVVTENLGKSPEMLRGHETTPTTTRVTVTTDRSTMMVVNGKPGGVGDMAAGDKFFGLFTGSQSDPIQTLTASPALFILDHSPPAPKQLYGFVGTVTWVNPTGGTVSVTGADFLPSTLAVPGTPATFTVNEHTLILGGSSTTGSLGEGLFGLGGSLGTVSMGDVVVGVLVAPQGDTLSQVEAVPLNLLLDFPAPPSAPAAARVKANALKDRLALIEGKSIAKPTTPKTHKQHSKHHHKKSHKHAKKGWGHGASAIFGSGARSPLRHLFKFLHVRSWLSGGMGP